jgi:HEXXH motif-containing protein
VPATEVSYAFLACPQEPEPSGFLESLLTARVQQTIEIFLDRWARDLDRWKCEGLSGFLRDGLAELNTRTAWHLAQGRLFRALKSTSDAEVIAAAAGVAMHFTSKGIQGSWRCQAPAPIRLMAGRWLLPAAVEVDVTSAPASFALRLDAAPEPLVFTFDGREYAPNRPIEPILSAGDSILLMTPECLTADERPDGIPSAEWRADRGAAETLDRALSAIGHWSPAYDAWVRRAFPHVVLIDGTTERLRSGTVAHQYGLSYMSLADNPIALSESLVHEASHQHLHIATWLEDVDTGQDRTLYYSPAVQRERPLSRILLAYHAFANVLLMYRSMLAAGFDVDHYARDNNASMSRDVAELDKPLRGNRALTDVGRSLYEPLAERLG